MAEAPKIPRIVRERLLNAQAGARATREHLDADLLAAYAENSLPRRERDSVLNHLAVCENCREAVMLSLPESTTTAAPARDGGLLPGWMGLRWAALAACFVLTVGVVLLNRNFEQAKVSQAPASSEQPPRAVAVAPSGPPERRFESAQSESKTSGFGGGVLADEQTQLRGALKSRAKKDYKADVGRSAKSPTAPAAAFDRLSSFGASEKSASGSQNSVAAASPATSAANAAGASNEKHETQAAGVGSVGKLMRVAPGVTAQSSAEIAHADAGTQVTNKGNEADASGMRGQEPSKKKTAPETTPAVAAALPSPPQARAQKAPASPTLRVQSEGYFQTKDQLETLNQEKLATASSEPAMQWRIRAGRLQQSNDTGKTWQELNVAPGVKLHAFWTQGSSVWAGGTAGSLFHVTDAGKQAVRIPIRVAEGEVAETVVAVTFTDELNGTIMLESNLVLQTTDGGKTWERR